MFLFTLAPFLPLLERPDSPFLLPSPGPGSDLPPRAPPTPALPRGLQRSSQPQAHRGKSCPSPPPTPAALVVPSLFVSRLRCSQGRSSILLQKNRHHQLLNIPGVPRSPIQSAVSWLTFSSRKFPLRNRLGKRLQEKETNHHVPGSCQCGAFFPPPFYVSTRNLAHIKFKHHCIVSILQRDIF